MTTKKYLFETKEFGVSEEGFHLLRSRYNYATISFEQTNLVWIGVGQELKNWLIILLIGLGLFGFSIYSSLTIFQAFTDDSIDTIYIEEILIPVIPFFMGAYCIFMGLRKGQIMRVQTQEGKLKQLSLNELSKNKQMEEFQTLLLEKLQGKIDF
ncbi:hypothetical protein BKI52_03585 [marine bacterium AO1-C]|nr:hypothetical protein BKI52_03585 [marine bacterium AO1-C]